MLTEPLLRAYEALVGPGAALSLPGRTLIEVAGADRAAFLHNFTTNDVKKLQAGQGCEAFVTSHQGKTLGHVLIFCEPDRHVLETVPGQAAALIAHFEKFVISERVEFHDRTGAWSEALLTGDRGASMIERLTGSPPPATLLQRTTTEQAIAVRKVPFANVPCWFLQYPTAEAANVTTAVAANGCTMFDHPELFDVLRLEAGWPSFGSDITVDNLPQEVARDSQAISFKKGCYLGQETVARLDALGHVNRLLAGVQFAEGLPPDVGAALLLDGKEVGKITSVAWSPKLQAPLGLALLRQSAASATAALQCDGKAAKVVQLPLV